MTFNLRSASETLTKKCQRTSSYTCCLMLIIINGHLMSILYSLEANKSIPMDKLVLLIAATWPFNCQGTFISKWKTKLKACIEAGWDSPKITSLAKRLRSWRSGGSAKTLLMTYQILFSKLRLVSSLKWTQRATYSGHKMVTLIAECH